MDNITVVKPKKFALPRFYVRHTRLIDADTEIVDELTMDNYTYTKPSTSSEPTVNNVESHKTKDLAIPDIKERKGKNKEHQNTKTPHVKAVKTKAPTAYNIFIKETCETLMKTRANLTPRERYTLAIQMWNERKGKDT